jgi:hypothetical protein
MNLLNFQTLVASKACRLVLVAGDKPLLDYCAYKLQEYAGRPCRKRSEGKATWPGRKQVHCRIGSDGCLNGDIITVEGDWREGEPLLGQVMQGGTRVASPAVGGRDPQTCPALADTIVRPVAPDRPCRSLRDPDRANSHRIGRTGRSLHMSPIMLPEPCHSPQHRIFLKEARS